MSTLQALGTTVLPMAEKLDPNDVRPGWLALAVFLAMAAATALLLRSFVKQTKRIDFDDGVARSPDGRRLDGDPRPSPIPQAPPADDTVGPEPPSRT